jgi:hypothetical protein
MKYVFKQFYGASGPFRLSGHHTACGIAFKEVQADFRVGKKNVPLPVNH